MRTVTIGGKEFELKYGENAICALEDATGKTAIEILDIAFKGKQSFSLMRAILWAGLLHKHRGATQEMAGDLLDGAQDAFSVQQEAFAELHESVQSRIPVAEPKEEKKDETKNAVEG